MLPLGRSRRILEVIDMHNGAYAMGVEIQWSGTPKWVTLLEGTEPHLLPLLMMLSALLKPWKTQLKLQRSLQWLVTLLSKNPKKGLISIVKNLKINHEIREDLIRGRREKESSSAAILKNVTRPDVAII